MKELALLRGYLGQHRRLIVTAVLVSLLLAIADVPFPFFIKRVIDDVLRSPRHRHFLHFDIGWERTTELWIIFGLFLVNAAAKGVLAFTQRVVTERVGQGVIKDLRRDLFSHLQSLDLTFFKESSTGQLMLRFIGDITSVLDLVTDGILRVLMDSMTIATVVLVLFLMNWRLALITCSVLPLYVWPFVRWSPRVRQFGHAVRDERARLSGNLQEKIAGIAVVKAFGQEPREQARFEQIAENLRGLEVERARWSGRVNGSTLSVVALCGALILCVGGRLTMEPGMTRGDLMAFYVLATLLFPPLKRLSRTNDVYQAAVVALDRIREFFEVAPERIEKQGGAPLRVTSGEVEFDHVTFAYPEDSPVLEDLSFRVKGGQVVALVGPNGCGKTTLVSLVPRFFEAASGTIRIDGQDISQVDLHSLREQVGIVGQDTQLFSGTVRDNIAYARPTASPEEIDEAARVANASDFIGRFRHGIDQKVGERGSKVSGGQRQRIAIARAVLRNPRILILDEATSAVDSESEALIQEALLRVMQGRTTFVIAHRVSTVRRADLILVMEKGRILESGTHSELLHQGGAYTRICREQLISDEPTTDPLAPVRTALA